MKILVVTRGGPDDASPTCAVQLGRMSFLPDAGRREIIWNDETFNTLKPARSLDKFNDFHGHHRRRCCPADGAVSVNRRPHCDSEGRSHCVLPGVHGTPLRSWHQQHPESPVSNGFGDCARKLLQDGSRSDQVFHARRIVVHQSQSEPQRPGCSRCLYPPQNGYTPSPSPCNGHTPNSTPTPNSPPTTLNLSASSTPHRKHHGKPTITSPTRLHTISENLGLMFKPLKRRKTKSEDGILSGRSSSIPNHLDELLHDGDSDSDDDDYGFRSAMYTSLPTSSLSPAMQKAKTTTSSSTAAQQQQKSLLTRKWRNKSSSKLGKSTPCLWRPEGLYTWSSMSGRKVVLTATNLTSLSEVERLSIQKIALAKLQRMDLGCPITTPKDWTVSKRSKRSGFSLKRRTMSGSFLDNFKDKGKDKEDSAGSGWTFGIPIGKCIANDVELHRRKPSLVIERRESLDLTTQLHRPSRKSSSSSGGASGVSSDSLSEADSKSTGSNLLDALSLSSSTTNPDSSRRDQRTRVPQVPYVVHCCLKHLETYGLRVLGIFRIGSSKKRTKQLREEFDSSQDVRLNEEHNPHDVAALLKEYFRDLPDPLLTRDLYAAFIATRKLETVEKRLKALHLLVALLPRPNRDTLWALLSFLHVIAQHSTDSVTPHGQELPGNKMGAHNLATLFGPNILHTSKGGEFQVESLERAEERQDVIAIVREIVDDHQKVFELPVELYDEMFRLMQETNPEALDHLLKQKSASLGTEIDGDTCSSMFEESDSSSIPQSPSCQSEPDSAQLHGRVDSLPVLRQHRVLAPRVRSVDPPGDNVKIPVSYTVSAPDQGWYHPERSRSPASPRVTSPNIFQGVIAKAQAAMSPMLHGSQSCASSMRSGSRPQHLKLSSSSGSVLNKHQLAVPPTVYNKQRHSGSSSSSGYYAGSSRSGTNSPVEKSSPVVSAWFLESPSPPQQTSPVNSNLPLRCETTICGDRTKFHPTSSLHRPLHLTTSSSESSLSPAETLERGDRCAGSKSWQLERWKHWQKLARENSDDYHEQETLV